MKGVIFQVVREIVVENYGDETWEDLLDAAGSDGVFSAGRDYPDEALEAVIAGACKKLNVTRDELLVTIGKLGMPKLAQRYPAFVENHDNLRSFLESIHGTIHVEVVRLFRDAKPPSFEYESPAENTLDMIYSSNRKMSALAEGFIHGAAALFDQTVDVTRKPDGDKAHISVVFN